MTAPLLAVSGLEVGYKTTAGMVTPIKGFDLSIHPREIVGLVGDAGSGKSTAALALIGLVRPPGRILGGSVMFEGRDILAMGEAGRRKLRGADIGIIVQNPRGALHPMLKIGKQIGTVFRAHREASAAQGRTRAIEMLRSVGINDPERRANAFAHELSGGMAQRALISIALSSSPKLLIADEPTSGLDVTIQAQFLDEMAATVRKAGSAVLLVTQDLGIVANYCDRVVVLHDGMIVEDQPTRDFFAAPRHAYSRDILKLARAEPAASSAIASAAAPLIAVDGLTKHFPVKGTDKVVQAVENVSFDIHPGETLALVGESGSGKTTVGRCLLRLAEATAGSVRYRGQSLGDVPPAEMRRLRAKLQVVFQDPYDAVNPRFSIGDVVREPLDLHTTLSPTAKTARVRDLLERVGLNPARLGEKPRGLGAGGLQRLSIARALATDPEFIVLDEPTSVLSPIALVGFVELLARLKAELSVAYLFISHDLTTVKHVSDRVAVMYLGQIVEVGPAAEVFQRPRHPYSQALMAAHLGLDPTRRRLDQPDQRRLRGEIPSPIDLPRGCYLASRCAFATDDCRTTRQTLTPAGASLVRCGRVERGEIP